MIDTRVEETDSFNCEDSDGNQYTIVELTKIHSTQELDKATKTNIRGVSEYQTSQGQHVNLKDDGTFEIVGTGTVVWKV